jgi:serine/threonine protein kinase
MTFDLGLPPLPPLFPELAHQAEEPVDQRTVSKTINNLSPYAENLLEGQVATLAQQIRRNFMDILFSLLESETIHHFSTSAPFHFIRPITLIILRERIFLFVHFNQANDPYVDYRPTMMKQSMLVDIESGRRYTWITDRFEYSPVPINSDYLVTKERRILEHLQNPGRGVIVTFLFCEKMHGKNRIKSCRLQEATESSLGDFLNHDGSRRELSVELMLTWMEDLLIGLTTIHQGGIIHRNLSLETVALVKDPEGSLHAKISWFNNAVFFSEQAFDHKQFPTPTRHKTINGLLPFQQEMTDRSDVFALGIIFCQVVLGPITGLLTEESLLHIQSELQHYGAIGTFILSLLSLPDSDLPSAEEALTSFTRLFSKKP